MSEENKAIVRRGTEEGFGGGNLDVADDVAADDFVNHTPVAGQEPGREGLKGAVTTLRTAFPDLRVEIEDLIAEGDKVAARTTMRGTHRGDFFGIPPSGKVVEMTGVHVLRIADGKIAEHWGSNDDLGLMRQLGVVP